MYEPSTFEEFIGQDHIITELRAMLTTNSSRSIIFRGNYGSGKTTLATIYAKHRGDYTYQPVPERLVNLPNEAKTHILDEAHRIETFEELYEEVLNKTYIFCSTEIETLPDPLVSRCVDFVFSPYKDSEIAIILSKFAYNSDILLDDKSAKIIASRSRGIPRVAIQLLERIHMFAKADKLKVSPKFSARCLDFLKVYKNGLIEDDIRYLTALRNADGQMSLYSLASLIGRGRNYVTETLEPFLINKEFIVITSRGRILTDRGRETLNSI